MKHFFSKCLVLFLFILMLVPFPLTADEDTGKTGKKEQHQALSHRVKIGRAEYVSAGDAKSYPGTVHPATKTDLAFRVGGPLVRVKAGAGEKVEKGRVLMEIDPRDYKDSIQVLEARLAGAQAMLENAEQEFGRVKILHSQKVAPQSDFDKAKTMYDTAKADIRHLKAQLQIANHKLWDTTLKAPFAGVIIETKVENHEMIRPGQVVLTLQDIRELEIVVNVPENEILNIPLEKGVPAEVSFPALPEKHFPVQLKEWSTAADSLTRTYALTYAMPAPDGIQILPGMTAEVKFSSGNEPEMAVSVPASALVTSDSEGPWVWVFDPGTKTAAKRMVEPGGFVGGSRIRINKGLSRKEMIVISGMDFITPEMTLIPTEM